MLGNNDILRLEIRRLSLKQILQSLSNGETSLVDVPVAKPLEGYVLTKTITSLVSVGTERMLSRFW